ncbi:hypothetical protein ACRAWF_44045 [Streptomyces sp. L7]
MTPESDAEAPSDGVSVRQVTENGTELDVVFTGVRTSTLISFLNVPLFEYVVRNTRSCLVFPPPDGNESVFQPGSETEPLFSTHR